jgi:hypothetical protein
LDFNLRFINEIIREFNRIIWVDKVIIMNEDGIYGDWFKFGMMDMIKYVGMVAILWFNVYNNYSVAIIFAKAFLSFITTTFY